MQTKTINSLNEYIAYLTLTKPLVLENDYVFRGQSNAEWPVSSSAARRLNKVNSQTVSSEDFQKYHQQLLDEFKRRKFHIKTNGKTISELELLGEIQHFEGATGLIDFTFNALIALWFAADEFENADGRVFIFNLTNRQDMVSDITTDRLQKPVKDLLAFQEFKSTDSEQRSKITQLQRKNNDTLKLWYWTPVLNTNERIFAQHSCFLFGLPAIPERYFDFSINVAHDKKKEVRDAIEVLFNLNHSRLFADFGGYSRYCHHLSIDPIYFTGYKYVYKDAFELYRQGEYANAAKTFGAVIDIAGTPDNILSRAYFRRGLMHRLEKKLSEAILDFNKAIEMGSDNDLLANAYGNRGAIYAESEDEEKANKAILDFTKVIDIQDSPSDLRARAYFYRAVSRYKLATPQIKEAIEDYTHMFKTDDNIPLDLKARAYINRGICWSKRTDLPKSERLNKERADYTSVIDMEDAPVDLKKIAEQHKDKLQN